MVDAHSALRTTVIAEANEGGIRFSLIELQDGKTDIRHALHATAFTHTSYGLQREHFLSWLGFRTGEESCPFVTGPCMVREVARDFPTSDFAKAASRGFAAAESASRSFDHCGFFFHRRSPRPSGDGHRASKVSVLKQSEDEFFSYRLTWLEGGRADGWTVHYAPKHPPLSAELAAVLRFLELRQQSECPELEFESCHWRGFEYEEEANRSPFNRSVEYVHKWFDAHAQHFAPGAKSLLESDLAVRSLGMGFLGLEVSAKVPVEAPPASGTPRSESGLPESFDVAISYAGAQRESATRLAEMLRAAGVEPFFDQFYPEQLWGKDLVPFQLRSTGCMMYGVAGGGKHGWPVGGSTFDA